MPFFRKQRAKVEIACFTVAVTLSLEEAISKSNISDTKKISGIESVGWGGIVEKQSKALPLKLIGRHVRCLFMVLSYWPFAVFFVAEVQRSFYIL